MNEGPKIRKTSGNWIGKFSLLFVSITATLLLCEIAARFVLDPVDYLSPGLARDDILGIRLPPGSGGHDQWGFRNAKVPDSAEIVALGDSHTYGNCAKMNEAWPKVLASLSGKSVYNLGMGGYGPNQYYHLFQTRALSLKPKTIIIGLYLGDDFDNAYRITYGLDHWASWREGGPAGVDPDIWERDDPQRPSLQKRVRVWLSEHSLLYKLVVHGVLQGVKGRYQLKNATAMYPNVSTLILPEKNMEEAFLPNGVLRGLDQQKITVQEGIRITFKILHEMQVTCSSRGINLIVAIIPTKELVFARYLEHNSAIAMGDVIDKVIVNGRAAREKLVQFLTQENIRFVNLLPAMEKASEAERIYTYGASDMHPNKNGYRIIAEEISAGLKPAAK